jgi:hypothetical protein
LQTGTAFEPGVLHFTDDAKLATEPADEVGVLSRFLAAQAVIHVQHRRLATQGDYRAQERYRIWPA